MAFGNSFGGGVASSVADGSITAAKLASGAVTTAKIADANVTPAKLSQPYTQGTSFTLSGVSYDITGIPSWVTQIRIKFAGLSTTGTSSPILQIGSSGGIEASNYAGSVSVVTSAPSVQAASITSGLALTTQIIDTSILNGEISLSRIDSATNLWMMAMNGSYQGGSITIQSLASKALSGVLTQLRLTTFAGSDSFDGGTASISWQ